MKFEDYSLALQYTSVSGGVNNLAVAELWHKRVKCVVATSSIDMGHAVRNLRRNLKRKQNYDSKNS